MSISWETVLVALIQALTTITTAWIERCSSRRGRRRKQGADQPPADPGPK